MLLITIIILYTQHIRAHTVTFWCDIIVHYQSFSLLFTKGFRWNVKKRNLFFSISPFSSSSSSCRYEIISHSSFKLITLITPISHICCRNVDDWVIWWAGCDEPQNVGMYKAKIHYYYQFLHTFLKSSTTCVHTLITQLYSAQIRLISHVKGISIILLSSYDKLPCIRSNIVIVITVWLYKVYAWPSDD